MVANADLDAFLDALVKRQDVVFLQRGKFCHGDPAAADAGRITATTKPGWSGTQVARRLAARIGTDAARGLFVGGGFEQLVVQFVAAVAVLIFSFVVAYVLGLAIEKTIGFRVKNEDEIAGIDTVVHGEEGYALVD